MPNTKFGEWLREARESKGWNGERLAEEVGTSQGNVSMYERGERQPRRHMVKKIADALGVNADAAYIAAGFTPDEGESTSVKIPLSTGPTVTIHGLDGPLGKQERDRFAALAEAFLRTHRHEGEESD